MKKYHIAIYTVYGDQIVETIEAKQYAFTELNRIEGLTMTDKRFAICIGSQCSALVEEVESL